MLGSVSEHVTDGAAGKRSGFCLLSPDAFALSSCLPGAACPPGMVSS